MSVIGASALAQSDRPLADVMTHALGGNATGVVATIALLTTTNTSLLALTAASRLGYGMAAAGALPPAMSTVSKRTGAPTAGILGAALGAVAFALIGDLTFVASVTDFAVYAVFLAVNAAVIVLRRTAPDAARPFRIPGAIHGVPLIPIAGTLAALAMVPQLDARSLWLGSALLAAGLLAHELLDRTSNERSVPRSGRAEPPCRRRSREAHARTRS